MRVYCSCRQPSDHGEAAAGRGFQVGINHAQGAGRVEDVEMAVDFLKFALLESAVELVGGEPELGLGAEVSG